MSITVVIDPGAKVLTSGRALTFDQAQAQFAVIWEECRAWAKGQTHPRGRRIDISRPLTSQKISAEAAQRGTFSRCGPLRWTTISAQWSSK